MLVQERRRRLGIVSPITQGQGLSRKKKRTQSWYLCPCLPDFPNILKTNLPSVSLNTLLSTLGA